MLPQIFISPTWLKTVLWCCGLPPVPKSLATVSSLPLRARTPSSCACLLALLSTPSSTWSPIQCTLPQYIQSKRIHWAKESLRYLPLVSVIYKWVIAVWSLRTYLKGACVFGTCSVVQFRIGWDRIFVWQNEGMILLFSNLKRPSTCVMLNTCTKYWQWSAYGKSKKY